MKTAICVLTADGWTPIITLGEVDVTPIVVPVDTASVDYFDSDPDIFDDEEEDPEIPRFEIGETVAVNGRLYQGVATIERFDGEDILARAGNGKLYRYDMGDQIANVITKIPEKDHTAADFEAGQEVRINGRLYQGYGTVDRTDGSDVLVRADNGKLYRYNPSDIASGVLSKG